MKKFKVAKRPKLSDKLKRRAAKSMAEKKPKPEPDPEFEKTMAAAFPEHLRGSISGCCDSMEDGHGSYKK